ncbi:MAG: L-glutamine--D-fructose-6-phosphate aminotransferase [Sodalis sp. Psp]|nr:L-glutamine--D-fructose-6-phosphate aminotransferase [Sodalis sp. Psp]MCR3757309.1 L-glutamine--D-fructose-6-phosphate aminotransferase [Sodalis sp. Ppy]
MCGIVGAVAQRDIAAILLEGLRRLEYRGYDSAGLAMVDQDGRLQRLRRVGKVKALAEAAEHHQLSGGTGIAHTRWATHGEPTEDNAHPHVSDHIVVVHNGVIENHEPLREQLREHGYAFVSETDTEVIAHLVHWEQRQQGGTLVGVMQRVVSALRGAYGMVIMDSLDPSALVAARSGSPLVIGRGVGENFLGSDQLALLPVTRLFMFLEEGDIAEITRHTVRVWEKAGKIVERPEIESRVKYDIDDKEPYRHYMQKEIFQQPQAIKNTLEGRLNHGEVTLAELGEAETLLRQIQHVQIIACGTSYHSAMVSRYWFEALAGVTCDVEIASEFRYRKSAAHPNTLLITLSQSGETADTLAVLRLTKTLVYLGSLVVCNVVDSSLVRESDMAIMTKAGTEIGVASTKTFTTQLTVLLMLVVRIGRLRAHAMAMDKQIEANIVYALQALPSRIEQVLSLNKPIESLAESFLDKHHALFLGRGDLYPIAMEGALKLKEISYIHAEAYAAGELKHGPLALIDPDMPVIVIAPNNKLLDKLKSNIEEVRARGGQLYVFAEQGTNFIESKNMKIIHLPHVEQIVAPIFYAVPMQLLAYHIALIKGADIDQPRNLAKSVTVE